LLRLYLQNVLFRRQSHFFHVTYTVEIKRSLELRVVISARKKNGFVTATKLGTKNEFFVASTKNFAAANKRFVDRTKHFVVVTKYFYYPYFNKLLYCDKTFFSVRPKP